MTKQLHRLAATVQRKLLDGPWPPQHRILIEAWTALVLWHESGEHVFRVRDGARSPALDPALDLVNAPVARLGQCYVMGRDRWIVVGRVAAQAPIRVQAPERVLAFSRSTLVYCCEAPDGGLAAGEMDLQLAATPRGLRLVPGTSVGELGVRPLNTDDISPEGILLAQVLPYFFTP